jgi:hypothetical protein
MSDENAMTPRKESDEVKRSWWLAIPILMSAAALFAPPRCAAQAKCPWLNAATAAGVLGGDVQMAMTASTEPGPVKGVGTAMYSDQVRMDRFDVTCEFTRKVASGADTLRIAVKTMGDQAKEFPTFLALCGGLTVALKGIGNEAVQCVIKNNAGMAQQEVIARVRDRAFVLTITRQATEPGAASGDDLRDDTRNTAEQIAGSLF